MIEREIYFEFFDLVNNVVYTTNGKLGTEKIDIVKLNASAGKFSNVNSVDFQTLDNIFKKNLRLRINVVINEARHSLCDGVVSSVEWNGHLFRYIVVDKNSLDILVPDLLYKPQCNFIFGSPRCGYDRESNKLSVEIVEIGQNYVKLNSDYFSSYPKHLELHQGVVIRVAYYVENEKYYVFNPQDYQLGDAYLYPICAKTIGDCSSFNNVVNYGGYLYVPSTTELSY